MSTPGGPTTRPIPTVPSGDSAKAASESAEAAAAKAAEKATEKPAEKVAAPASSPGAAGSAAGSAPRSASGAKPGSAPSVPPMPQRPAPRTTGTGAPGRPAGARLVSGGPAAAGAPPRAGRKVQLAVTRIEPWSAFKMSLLLSTAAAVGFIVGTVLLWSVLKGMGVYDDIDGVIKNLQSNTSDPFSIMDYIGLGRVTSLAMVIGVVDVVLLTALGTLGAYLYNVCASLVGGVQLTLTDD